MDTECFCHQSFVPDSLNLHICISQSCRNQSHYLQLPSMEACEVDMVWHCQAGENGAPS
jgi:hypothetical protein